MDKLTKLKQELKDTRERMRNLCWQSATYRNLRDYECSLMRDIEELEAQQEQKAS